MHFLKDKDEKQDYLASIRKRLRPASPYVHVDVCFDGRADFERLQPVYAAHAMLNGIAEVTAYTVSKGVGTMPIISEEVLRRRFSGSWLQDCWANIPRTLVRGLVA